MSAIEKQARDLYANHQYEEAREEYANLLRQYPHNDDFMIMMGNCFDGQGDKKSAAQWYEKALKQNSKSLLARTNLATALYELNEFDKAQKMSEQALRIDNRNLPSHVNLGNIFYQQKEYSKALQAYQDAYDINPEYFIAVINLANIHLELKNYKEALQFARQAIEMDSSYVMAHTILGNALLELGEVTDSLAAFQQAATLDKTDFWIHNSLSQIWQKLENWPEAFSAGWKALKMSKGEDSQQINFGYLLYESTLEKGDKLREEYARKWLAEYPENAIAQHMANAVLNNNILPRANDDYLKNIFDVFAPDFEQVLTGLDYQAPTLIHEMLKKIYPHGKNPKLRILDAGCGTGFCGRFLKNYSALWGLYGVDISEKMLDQARAKKVYHKLFTAELESFFSSGKREFDLIVSTDVFTYFGDLEKLFSGIADNLVKKGRILFTVTENDADKNDVFLHASGRYLHSENYIKNILKKSGLEVEFFERAKLRNEGEKKVMGFVVSAIKQ